MDRRLARWLGRVVEQLHGFNLVFHVSQVRDDGTRADDIAGVVEPFVRVHQRPAFRTGADTCDPVTPVVTAEVLETGVFCRSMNPQGIIIEILIFEDIDVATFILIRGHGGSDGIPWLGRGGATAEGNT